MFGCYNGTKRRYCPMFFILLLDKKSLKYKGTRELFKSDLMLKCIDAYFRTTTLFIFVWFLFRCLLSGFVFLFDVNAVLIEGRYKVIFINSTENETCLGTSISSFKLEETGFLSVAAFVVCSSIAGLVLDFIELIIYCFKGENFYIFTPRGKKDILAHFEFYRLIQVLLHSFAIALVVVKLGRIYGDLSIPFSVDNLLFTGFGLFNFWSYMQLAQVLCHFKR